MNESAVILAIIGLSATLAGSLAWVVKRVFDFSDRHSQVVENNTKSNEAVSTTLKQMVSDLKVHTDQAQPAITAGAEVLGLIGTITKTLENIMQTQKEIIELIKGIKREEK